MVFHLTWCPCEVNSSSCPCSSRSQSAIAKLSSQWQHDKLSSNPHWWAWHQQNSITRLSNVGDYWQQQSAVECYCGTWKREITAIPTSPLIEPIDMKNHVHVQSKKLPIDIHLWDVGALRQKQFDDFMMATARRQVKWWNKVLCHDIGICAEIEKKLTRLQLTVEWSPMKCREASLVDAINIFAGLNLRLWHFACCVRKQENFNWIQLILLIFSRFTLSTSLEESQIDFRLYFCFDVASLQVCQHRWLHVLFYFILFLKFNLYNSIVLILRIATWNHRFWLNMSDCRKARELNSKAAI